MKLKVAETSLNLRVKHGRDRMEYTLSREVAEKQLLLGADVYANVEFMKCDNASYVTAFKEAGYNMYSAVDNGHRGILYAVKQEYEAEEIASMQDPHMFHIRIRKEKDYVDMITLRVLVAGSNDSDFLDRKQQWDKVMKYINGLEDKEHLILTGDWNHGVIAEFYLKNQPRRFFNYQMIVKSLQEIDMEIFHIEGMSFRGYMKIDHIAGSKSAKILDAKYYDLFPQQYGIGIPDHKIIVANLACRINTTVSTTKG